MTDSERIQELKKENERLRFELKSEYKRAVGQFEKSCGAYVERLKELESALSVAREALEKIKSNMPPPDKLGYYGAQQNFILQPIIDKSLQSPTLQANKRKMEAMERVVEAAKLYMYPTCVVINPCYQECVICAKEDLIEALEAYEGVKGT